MNPKLIDGKATAADITSEIKKRVSELVQAGHPPPGITVLLIGDRTDSATYVSMKQRACQDIGFVSNIIKYPKDVDEDQIVKKLNELNSDPLVHGILVQLPLPPHLDEKRITGLISIEKDVDGFHVINMGKLAMKGHEPNTVPCTPKGCLELLKRYSIPISGKNAVVLGRSNIVGIPMALLLLNENATVTICHSKTENIPEICRTADILVAAIGRAQYVKRDWIKPGATIIDVGMNSIPDATKKSGYRLVGDVDPDAYDVAGMYTPVPGGVGPMTVAMLMQNTLNSALKWYATTAHE
ncbi:uncharacterized protein LOC126331450 [Schistocerca gregaria]|uniref:uncharacterized protein LOC126331450 n=1 Tax=Schistocerca gregaria TaxID=7010 RepID=UPI00211DFC33|nr:uncharacterized protein LOC126331450 [Schistocerca gregaria]